MAITSVRDIMTSATAYGSHFFDADTMRCFGTRVSEYFKALDNGYLFITSDHNFDQSQRLYTVRMYAETVDAEKWSRFPDVSAFLQFSTLAQAKSYADSIVWVNLADHVLLRHVRNQAIVRCTRHDIEYQFTWNNQDHDCYHVSSRFCEDCAERENTVISPDIAQAKQQAILSQEIDCISRILHDDSVAFNKVSDCHVRIDEQGDHCSLSFVFSPTNVQDMGVYETIQEALEIARQSYPNLNPERWR